VGEEFRFFIRGSFSGMNNATTMARSTGKTPNRNGSPENSVSYRDKEERAKYTSLKRVSI